MNKKIREKITLEDDESDSLLEGNHSETKAQEPMLFS